MSMKFTLYCPVKLLLRSKHFEHSKLEKCERKNCQLGSTFKFHLNFQD